MTSPVSKDRRTENYCTRIIWVRKFDGRLCLVFGLANLAGDYNGHSNICCLEYLLFLKIMLFTADLVTKL